MKKIEFIETILERNREADPNVIEVYIARAWNQIMYETFRKDITNIDIYSKTYKNVDIKFDTDIEQYYSEMPTSIIQLPNDGDGVLSINTMKGSGIEFCATRAGMNDIHKDLEVVSVNGPIDFWIMNNRIEYEPRVGIEEIKKVRVRAIPQFEEIDELEDIYIPVGQDERLMELVSQFALGIAPEKEINDKSNKTP